MITIKALERLGRTDWEYRDMDESDSLEVGLSKTIFKSDIPAPTVDDLQTVLNNPTIEELNIQKEAVYSAWVEQGFDTGLGYKLRVSDSDQVAFSKLMSSLMLKNPSDSFEVKIEAMDGSIKTLTYLQFKTLMIAYGDYCYASWKAGKGIQ